MDHDYTVIIGSWDALFLCIFMDHDYTQSSSMFRIHQGWTDQRHDFGYSVVKPLELDCLRGQHSRDLLTPAARSVHDLKIVQVGSIIGQQPESTVVPTRECELCYMSLAMCNGHGHRS